MYLSIDIAINVKTDAATERYAIKLFIVQYVEPNIQFLQNKKIMINISLDAFYTLFANAVFLTSDLIIMLYLFFMKVNWKMALMQDIIRSAKQRLTRK